MISLRHT